MLIKDIATSECGILNFSFSSNGRDIFKNSPIFSPYNSPFYGERIKPRPLFNYLLREYSEYWSLYKCLSQGIDIPEMDYLIKRLTSKYPSQAPLHVTTPFRYKDGLTIQKILSACQAFLGAHTTSRRLILLGDQWHWSLVERMDSEYLYFFDSHQQEKVSRTCYGLRGNKVRRLYSESVYFIDLK